MTTLYKKIFIAMLPAALALAPTPGLAVAPANILSKALTAGQTYGEMRLRYEGVDQNNALDNADALTLRTMLGYRTGELEGFSATVEFEDSRIVGGGDAYSVPQTGFNTGRYATVSDPETTELEQGFVQYKNGVLAVKVGRQALAYDGQRFVGHGAWRQDHQTFDGLTIRVTPTKALTLNYAYLGQRNRVLAEVTDQNSKDHLLNIAYNAPYGKLVAYSYMLENNFSGNSDTNDTIGASFSGVAGKTARLFYTIEFARQTAEIDGVEFDADYSLLEGAVVISGLTAKLGYEVLGSDDANYGFATPLASLHKSNGWADQFAPATPVGGLVDAYLSVGGGLAGGAWAVAYHEFSADEETPGMEDYGDELDISYSRSFAQYFSVGIKYASYSADDFAVDTDKLWVWVGMSF